MSENLCCLFRVNLRQYNWTFSGFRMSFNAFCQSATLGKCCLVLRLFLCNLILFTCDSSLQVAENKAKLFKSKSSFNTTLTALVLGDAAQGTLPAANDQVVHALDRVSQAPWPTERSWCNSCRLAATYSYLFKPRSPTFSKLVFEQRVGGVISPNVLMLLSTGGRGFKKVFQGLSLK